MPRDYKDAPQIAICVLAIGFIVETILLGIFIVRSTQNNETTVNNICKYPESNTTCKIINETTNQDVGPCADFGEFVCGNSWKNLGNFPAFGNEIHMQIFSLCKEHFPEDQHIVLKTAVKLLRNCLNNYPVKLILETLIDVVGGWPLQDSLWNETEFDWLKATYKLRELGFPHSIFFNLSVAVNPKSKRDYVFKISLPKMDEFNHGDLANVVHLFGSYPGNIDSEVEDIENFVFAVKNHSQKEESRTIDGHSYNSTMDWGEFINRIVGHTIKIPKQDSVIFPEAKELNNRLDLLANTSKRTLAMYMIWKVLEEMVNLIDLGLIPKLDGRVRFIDNKFFHGEECLKMIDRRFAVNPISVLYARKYIPHTQSDIAKEMMMGIKREFLKLLNQADWMGGIDREIVIERINSMQIMIGAPDDYYDDHILDEMNADLEETVDDDLLNLILQLNKNYETLRLKQINSAVKKSDFANLNRQILGSVEYSYADNIMNIPLGFLQPFVLDGKMPNYFIYGNLGTIIGSHFVHFFENITTGFKVRENLDFLNHYGEFIWASNKTKEFATKQQNCLAKQVKENMKLQSIANLDYDILKRSLGIKLSYSAYKKRLLTPKQTLEELDCHNQLFWISYAHTMCGLVLVENKWLYPQLISSIAMNNKNFSKDFDCPIDSKMNPTEKCSIF